MSDDGTGTDPGTGRCPDCGHLEGTCPCACCGGDDDGLGWSGATFYGE